MTAIVIFFHPASAVKAIFSKGENMAYVYETYGSNNSPVYGWMNSWRTNVPTNLIKKSNNNGPPPEFRDELFKFLDFANPYLKAVPFTVRLKKTKWVTVYRKVCKNNTVNIGCRYKRVRIKKVYYVKRVEYKFYVFYRKLEAPLYIWCRKLKDFDSMPELYEEKQHELAEYVRKRLKDKCHKLTYPGDIKKDIRRNVQHSCYNFKWDASVIPPSGFLDAPDYKWDLLNSYYFAKYSRVHRMGYNDVSLASQIDEANTLRMSAAYWTQNLNDVVHEAWPTLENLSAPVDALELYREGIPGKPTTFNPRMNKPENLRNVAAGSWLTYNFGIAPLIGGILDIARSLKRLELAIEQWNTAYSNNEWVDGQSFTVYNAVEHMQSSVIPETDFFINAKNVSNSNSYVDYFIKGGRSFIKCEGHIKIRYKVQYIDALTKLSLFVNQYTASISSIAWELLPFSWLFDYFSDLQSYKHNLQNRTMIPVSSVEATYSHAHTVEDNYTLYTKHRIWDGKKWSATKAGTTEDKPLYETSKGYTRQTVIFTDIPPHSGRRRPKVDPSDLSYTQGMNILSVASAIFGSETRYK